MSKITKIELSNDDILARLKENVMKMLNNRVNDKREKLLEDGKIIEKKENIYEIKGGKEPIYMQIIAGKISSLKKTPAITSFLSEYKKYHKILILQEIPKKVRTQLSLYGNLEIFQEKELMADVLSNHYQPKFEVLTKEEKEECMKTYNTDKKQFSRMLKSDPITRYFNLKVGDLIRVIIPCETSGQKIEYGIVS